jgi:hypothetical protein
VTDAAALSIPSAAVRPKVSLRITGLMTDAPSQHESPH